jgi:hypothetical protein
VFLLCSLAGKMVNAAALAATFASELHGGAETDSRSLLLLDLLSFAPKLGLFCNNGHILSREPRRGKERCHVHYLRMIIEIECVLLESSLTCALSQNDHRQ